jgi:hypothetical protein
MIVRTSPEQSRRVQQIKSCHCAVYSKGYQSVIPFGLRTASSLVRHQRLAETSGGLAPGQSKATKLPFSCCRCCSPRARLSGLPHHTTDQSSRLPNSPTDTANTTTPRVVLPDCLTTPEPVHYFSTTSATPEQLPCLDARLRRAGRHCRCLEEHHLNT